MERKAEILTELQGLSAILAQNNPGHPYSVAAGYFEQLPGQVMQQLQAGPVLPVAADKGFSVPEGYFEGFPGSVLAKIRPADGFHEIQAELAEVAPLLNTVPRQDVYTVPSGYFEKLGFAIPGQQAAKVVSFRKARKWMQYAAAAVVAGVLVTGAFLITDSPYKNVSRMDVPQELQKLSENDLASYLYNPVSANVSQDMIGDVKENIHNMSDEELTNYLSENPDIEMIIPVSN